MERLSDAGFAGFKVSVVVTRENVGAARRLQGDRRPLRRAAAAHAPAAVGARRRRVGRAASDRRAAAAALRLAARPRRGRPDRRLVLPPRRLRRSAARPEPLRRRPRRVPVDPVGDVYACPFAIHDAFLAGNVREPGRVRDGLARVGALPGAAQAADERRVPVVLALRRLPRRLHGGEVLHRAAAGRPGPGVRARARRVAARPARRRARSRGRPQDHSAGRRPPDPTERATRARSPACRSTPHERDPDGRRLVRDGRRGAAAGEARLPKSVYRAIWAGLGVRPDAQGQRRRVRRARLRAARRRAGDRAGPVHHGHGPDRVAAGDHLADRRPGRASRRRGGGGPGRRRPRHGHGSEFLREQAGRGGRGREPADVLPGLLGRVARADPAACAAREGGRRRGAHRHARLVVLARPRLGQPGDPGAAGPQDDGQVRARGARAAAVAVPLGTDRADRRTSPCRTWPRPASRRRRSSAPTASGCRRRCRPGTTCAGCASSGTGR